MSSYKNNRVCYIPEHVVIRRVNSVLNEEAAQNDPEADRYFRSRISWALELLVNYAQALNQVREKGDTYREEFPFGM